MRRIAQNIAAPLHLSQWVLRQSQGLVLETGSQVTNKTRELVNHGAAVSAWQAHSVPKFLQLVFASLVKRLFFCREQSRISRWQPVLFPARSRQHQPVWRAAPRIELQQVRVPSAYTVGTCA